MGVICVLMLRVRWVELVWVDSGWFGLGCWVVELRVVAMCGCLRSASAPACSCGFIVGRVLCVGYLFGIVVSRAPVPRVSTIRRFPCVLPRFDAFRVLSV